MDYKLPPSHNIISLNWFNKLIIMPTKFEILKNIAFYWLFEILHPMCGTADSPIIVLD